jgi:hypothetical protein
VLPEQDEKQKKVFYLLGCILWQPESLHKLEILMNGKT